MDDDTFYKIEILMMLYEAGYYFWDAFKIVQDLEKYLIGDD